MNTLVLVSLSLLALLAVAALVREARLRRALQALLRRLFEEQISSPNPENYLIRVNRQPVPADQVLQEGDRVSFTPTKIEGA